MRFYLALVKYLAQISVFWNPIAFPLVAYQQNLKKYYFRPNILHYIIRKYRLKTRQDLKVMILHNDRVD